MGWLPPEIGERVVPKFDWIRMLERVPASSPFFTHELCLRPPEEGGGNRCERLDKKRGYVSRLRPSTICHIGKTLALKAEVDGTDAWLGIDLLAAKTKTHRVTVISALAHLEAKQLLYARVRGGSTGIPRTWATNYVLTQPPAKEMADAGLADLISAYDWFTHGSRAG